MRRYILFVLFLCLHLVAWGEARYTYRYWFDSDVETMRTGMSDGLALHLDAELSGLDVAFHTIHLQVKDDKDVWSSPVTRSFFKLPVTDGNSTYRYWIDGDYAHAVSGQYTGGEMMVDVSDADDGFHVLYMQVDCSNVPSLPQTKMFIKVPQLYGGFTYLCNIDGKLYKQEKVSSDGGAVSFTLDVNDLEQGLHRMQVQVVIPSGAATNVSEHFFLRAVTGAEIDGMSLLYNVDDQNFKTVKGGGSDGLFHFDLNVAELEDGLHRLTYMLGSERGISTKVSTAFFVKIPVGGYGIMSYKYWLNNDDTTEKSVTLAKRANPFSLVSLLPVSTCPIRSSCFCFEIVDGKPMIYAKNDIHFCFVDASSRIVETMRQYVDYSVSQTVDDVSVLQPLQTFTRPAANDIKWFKFEAKRGDSVSFRSSLATTIQLLDISGNTLYEGSGAKSVVFGGTHLMANGTYYLAVHDVTGTQSNSIDLRFEHIDKFALFDVSDLQFGVMPCVQIMKLDGNGFDNLQSACLRMGDKIIEVDSIAFANKSEAKLYMLFNGDEEYGKYDLVLNFDDGEDKRTITRNGYVSLTAPDFNDIKIEIIAPPSNLDPYPVDIKLTNESNISYQAIPFFFALDNIESITNVKYLNFAVGCNKELYEKGTKLSFEYDNFRGNNSKTRVVPLIIPELLPGESMTLNLGVIGQRKTFNTYAWIGVPWNLRGPEAAEFISNFMSLAAARGNGRTVSSPVQGIFNGCSEDPCDYADGLAECGCGMALSLGGTLGGIQNALQNRHNQAMRQQLEQSGLFDDPDEYFPDQELPSPNDLLWYWLQHCMSGDAAEMVSRYNSIRQQMDNNGSCPPEGHSCVPFVSSDPNEITGYTAESGSRYIGRDVKSVSYDIEFENDPEQATGPAHKVVVENELDGDVFDLASFTPKDVVLSGKRIELDGEPAFVKTVDLRPEINAIAEIKGEYDSSKGMAKWTLISLDPMTMEPTHDIIDGLLPVNNANDQGVGHVTYNINLKDNLPDGTVISNKASIIFDSNEAIVTPVWTNITDYVVPESRIEVCGSQGDGTTMFVFDGRDSRSGIWRYDLYMQKGRGLPWSKAAGNIEESEYEYTGIVLPDYGFCVLAVDSAGNVEPKALYREINGDGTRDGDMNGDGRIDIGDVVVVLNVMAGSQTEIKEKADLNGDGRVDIGDCVHILGLMANINKQ